MSDELKNSLSKKMSLASVKKKQLFGKSSSNFSKDLKIVSFPDNKEEELFYNLNKNLFQLEKDLSYFNFAVKEIKDIIKLY